ncbi:MAG: fumarate hydratase C-terminal domain-containing protein [Eisenbergiella sp.]
MHQGIGVILMTIWGQTIRELRVEHFPVIVVIDSKGNNLYETAVKEYSEE